MKKNESRLIAIANGQKTYEGSPCKNCRSTQKYVTNWSCVQCVSRSVSQRSPDVYTRYINSTAGQLWLKSFRRSSTYKDVQSRWLAKSGYSRIRQSKRRKYIKEQLINITEQETLLINEIYKKATQLTHETGIVHHVDHIIRLCDGGRHHPDNLQILTYDDHLVKTSLENKK